VQSLPKGGVIHPLGAAAAEIAIAGVLP
jgi:hypothetical protein